MEEVAVIESLLQKGAIYKNSSISWFSMNENKMKKLLSLAICNVICNFSLRVINPKNN